MKGINDRDLRRSRRNDLALSVRIALFGAGSAAVGYLLMAVPNIEGITAMLFTAGYALGAGGGVAAALIAAIIYFGINPQGGLFPPLFAAQVVGISFAPIAGWLFKKSPFQFLGNSRVQRNSPLLAVIALALTLFYDIITNLAYPLTIGAGRGALYTWLIAAVPFSLIHIIGNMFVFVMVLPALLDLVDKLLPMENW